MSISKKLPAIIIACILLTGCGNSKKFSENGLEIVDIEDLVKEHNGTVSDYVNGIALFNGAKPNENGKKFYSFVVNDKGEKLTDDMQIAYNYMDKGWIIGQSNEKDPQTDNDITTMTFVDKDGNVYKYSFNEYMSLIYDLGPTAILPDGRLWINTSKKLQILDMKTGKILTNPGEMLYQNIDCVTSNGNTVVSNKNGIKYYSFALVAPDGSVIIPFGKYGYIDNYSNGLARFSTDGKFSGSRGLVPIKGADFKEMSNFDSPLDNHSTIGYLDENGNVAIAEQFYIATRFNDNGLAKVSKSVIKFNPPKFKIDKKGNKVN